MNGLNLLVFREGRQCASGQGMKAALAEKLERLGQQCSRDALLAALLLAGELESGLADANSSAVTRVEQLADGIADALVLADSESRVDSSQWKSLCYAVQALPVFERLTISIPEGFAYYALDPLAYAAVPPKVITDGSALVVGIRSIGTTLSAVTAAAARASGVRVERLTVRPQGHPYDRSTKFSPSQLAIVAQHIAAGSMFIVVDEGPGLSGSSFLSVAEALEQAGAPQAKIILASSHAPDLNALCATDASRRWPRFRCVPAADEVRRPGSAVEFVGGGNWRSRVFNDEAEWPASWISFERLKYLSDLKAGERRIFKFVGFGHYGDAVFERELKVAAAGFGPLPKQESDGFVSYPWIHGSRSKGRPCCAKDISSAVLARMAEYCAFRVREFSVSSADLASLQQMAEHNLRELGVNKSVDLRLERPVIADGRMQPHEWLMADHGQLLKTDPCSHGNDHFFPGPTDIAWDLAGAIVEWRMDREQTREFLNLYCRLSGDNAAERIDGFIAAYAAFRAAYCLMAANAMAGSDEQPRLLGAANFYRTLLTESKTRFAARISSLSVATS